MNGLIIMLASLAISLSKPECTCVEWPMKKHLDFSDIILVGRIDSNGTAPYIYDTITIEGDTHYRMSLPTKRHFFMNVEYYYKGKGKVELKRDNVIIHTGNGFGDCGYGFTVGERYIVWGSSFEQNDTLTSVHTSICNPTDWWSLDGINKIERYRKPRKVE